MFNSVYFILSFPIIFVFYYLLPDKLRNIWLLIVSYAICMYMMPMAVLWLAGITILTYFGAIVLEQKRSFIRQEKLIFWILVLAAVSALLYSKYGSYIMLTAFHTKSEYDSIAPIGISFYTLQVIGYLIDVYRGEKAEYNLITYALYVSFFSKILSGPIERSEGFLQQLRQQFKKPDYQELRHGVLILCWGYFEKIVVADHAAILVNTIFDGYSQFSGITLVKGAILYGIQLYADFDGYTHIARGCAELLGYHLINNFEQPYFATSVKNFWRRWHISLSGWLRDYIYFPLGGSRQGKFRTYVNLMVTFLISGFWHGVGFKYIAWGALHGIYQLTGRATRQYRIKLAKVLRIQTECLSYRIFQSIVTFVFVDFAWIIFRAESLGTAKNYIIRMLTDFRLSDIPFTSLYSIVDNSVMITMMFMGIFVMFLVDIMHECKINMIGVFEKQNLIFRYLVYITMIMLVGIAYIQTLGLDISAFIYAHF